MSVEFASADYTAGQLNAIIKLLKKQAGEDGPERFLRGELAVFENKTAVSSSFVHDKTKDGWELVASVNRRIILVRDLELVSFLKKSESRVNGEEMARRAVDLGADFGQEDAEYILEHQDEIPAEFRDYYLVFPGTVWRNADGVRSVPYLSGYGKRWYLNFGRLGYDWNSNDRLIRPRK